MKEKQIKLPGPDHPISILRNPARVVVSVAGRVVADTRNALTLCEAAYQPVQYIPREDVDSSQLKRTDHATNCPYKGDCNYYADTLPDMEYVIKKLNDYDLAHLLMMGATTDFTGGPLEHLAGDGLFQHFRPLYNGHLIANVDMTQERGNRLIKTGLTNSIAFGRPFIANPDLPERFLTGATLNQISWPTVYASGPEGYTDYPAMRGSSTDEDSPKKHGDKPNHYRAN